MPEVATNGDIDRQIHEAYTKILGRPADPSGIESYRAALSNGILQIVDVCADLAKSEEFLQARLANRGLAVFRLDSIAGNSRFLELSRFPEYEALSDVFSTITSDEFAPIFDATLAQSSLPQVHEYVLLHKERFRQTMSFVAAHANENGAMLEVSTSPYTPFMKSLYKGRMITADYGGIHPGVDNVPNPAINSDMHISIDLNRERLTPRISAIEEKGVDLILFCEIIEHLLPSPFDLVRDLAGCLKPGGRLLISTPNAFGIDRAIRMNHGQHPSALLPAGESFLTGAHHVREYTMDELLHIAREAGLKPVHFAFSACWDSGYPKREFVELHPTERSCLMMVAERPI